ncbi:DUF748 domain-containing protein [Ramlibacter sp. XY19]|uniref:DUF748 domain-containing protein n=1 Tax=Ramlibacter paludis TaxID=2908000 RepID=UPI0023D98F65|nr:DUF748 domain-containing protein [Ramlibacter paludis]MCG2591696.1 DUF748 domain-containing protein [Ramlibacter paludis]
MWPRILKVARSLPVLAVAGLFVAWLLAGFFLVDPLARKLLPWAGERYLASRLQAQRVDFNPLTLELRVQGLALAEPGGEPLAGVENLYLDLGVDGLARWAWRIHAIELQRPHARFVVRQGGASNWNALIARLREDAGPPSDRMARLLIDRIRIADGDILYSDADRPGEPFEAAFKPLGIELAAISTLPEDRGEYLIAARLPQQGATLRWKGDIALNPLVSQGEVALEGAHLERLRRLVEDRIGLAPSGTLAAALHYRFALLRARSHADVPSLVVTGANLQVRDFALAPRDGGEPLLQLAEARVSDAAFDLLKREIAVGALHLQGGKVRASRDAQGVLDWQALLASAPASGSNAAAAGDDAPPWKFALRDLRLTDWSARFTDHGYATPLEASAEAFELSAAVAGELGATPLLGVGPVNASAGPVRLVSGAQQVAQLQRVALSNGLLALPENRLRIDAIALTGARAEVLRDKDQRVNWMEILRRSVEPPAAATPASAPPDLRVARLSADDIQLRVSDSAGGTPVTLDLAGGRVALSDVGLDLERAIPLEAAFSLQQGGRFEAKGTITPARPAGRLDLKLAGLALAPFAPYVNQFARLKLQSGSAGVQGKLAFAPAKAGVGLAFNGGFQVDDLAIVEEEGGAPFLGWKKLSSGSTSISLGPDRVHIGEVVAVKPLVKVIIFEDQSLNLTRMLRTSAALPAAAPAPAQQQAQAVFPVAIERLRIVDADAEFADLSLRPQFGTGMHALNGVVTGLSSDPAANAQVELDGKVEEFGSARIRGAIQPFRATEFTDLGLAFRNLEMTRLTPYSGKFAGRRIESGRLSVDLQYKVQARQLAGANKFVIQKLRLGENVDSPGAMKLPLDLAIALLEDSDGVIDLDLPVSGSLDDPQFSYGAIVWKAVVNVLKKLVTAPFRALGAALGMNTDTLEAVGFDPGSSVLLPPEQEKLKLLAEALAKRPALTVTIAPGYDPGADRRALQETAMRREAATAASLKLTPGQDPGPVDVNNYKVQTWLEERYAASAGKQDYQQLRAGYQDKDAGAVTRLLQSQTLERLGRSFKERDAGPASAFHAELLERLTVQVAVADDALLALAQQRAQAMREAVVKLGLQESRVAVGAPAPHALKDKMVASGLALGAGSAAPARPPTAQSPAPTSAGTPG